MTCLNARFSSAVSTREFLWSGRSSNLGVVKPSFANISSALVDIASALILPRQSRSFCARLPSPTFGHSWASFIISWTSERTSLEPLSLWDHCSCRVTHSGGRNTMRLHSRIRRKSSRQPPVLAYYDPRHATSLHVDASRLHDLGFVLKQHQNDNSWRMVRVGSRYLSEIKSHYGMIEIEMLGIAWAIGKCRVFLEGLPHFEDVTDHQPLITILNKYHIGEIKIICKKNNTIQDHYAIFFTWMMLGQYPLCPYFSFMSLQKGTFQSKPCRS